MIDRKWVRQARQTDLIGYLLSVGEPLTRNGHRYKHKEHDSLVFTKNAYFWNSRQEHGNAVDYLIRHKNMSFEDAVRALVGFVPLSRADGEPLQLSDIEISQDYKRAIAYLNKTRGIDYSVIKRVIDDKHLYQEQKTNNIIFPMYDEAGQCIGAELQGTLSEKRFKGVRAGSKHGYGFNVRFGNVFDYALFFESAIDLLSFIDVKCNTQGKSLNHCILISMAGLKPNILKHTLEAFTGDLRAVLCVDNDNAGEEFKNIIKGLGINFKMCQPDRRFKDWNDQLKGLVK